MKVILRNDWFGPDGSLHRRSDNPHTFVDEWRAALPPSAIVQELIITEQDAIAEETAELRKRKELAELTTAELVDMAEAQGVEYDENDTRDALIDAIIDNGE